MVDELNKWEEILGIEMTISELQNHFKSTITETNSTKLRSLQFNILHHMLVLNEYVFQRRRRNTNLCSFCDVHVETMVHFFWECQLVQPYWEEIKNRFSDMCFVNGNELRFSATDILFNQVHESQIANLIILPAKYNLYRTRCMQQLPSWVSLIMEVCNFKSIEKYNAILQNKLHRHEKKWNNINNAGIGTEQLTDDYVNDYINMM